TQLTAASGAGVRLAPGTWTVSGDVTGFGPFSREVSVIPTGPQTITIALTAVAPERHGLRLGALPPGVDARDILIDGVPWDGKDPEVLRPPGTEVRIRIDSPYYDFDRRASVAPFKKDFPRVDFPAQP